MNRTILISSIVFISLVSVVVAIYSSDSEEGIETGEKQQAQKPSEHKQVAVITPKKSEAKQEPVRTKATKPKPVVNKTTSKQAVKQTDTSNSSNTRVVRVRWPGMKHRMVRVVKVEEIEPATELRTWSRKQWINKVTNLRKANKDDLAEEYITAYNRQYPKKDLNTYLK